ncbi:anti-sigma factor family protein [Streptomyces sp. CA-249302]|uniref:anti-sigma factor family protein n=1 Tax=Streptomyces sp. CA-249302 TaxID=3240058 RepID=UPI003D8F57C6
MTSTTDMTGHPDVAEISDLTEGLLTPSRTTDVRQHLDECELCADVYTSLEEIRGLLGTLPGPTHMPADVAGRIDAALAAEALLNATAPDDAHVSRETSAPADRPSGHARGSSTGPGRKNRKRAGRRRVAVLGSVFAVAALGLGSVLIATFNDGKPSGTEANGRQTTAADTFSEKKLEKDVADLLVQKQTSGRGSTAPHNSSVGALGGGDDPGVVSPKIDKAPTVPTCVQRGIGSDDAALATKKGTFEGTDALLVVLTDTSDSTKVTAYIMDATCATHPSAGDAKVLLKHTYNRS